MRQQLPVPVPAAIQYLSPNMEQELWDIHMIKKIRVNIKINHPDKCLYCRVIMLTVYVCTISVSEKSCLCTFRDVNKVDSEWQESILITGVSVVKWKKGSVIDSNEGWMFVIDVGHQWHCQAITLGAVYQSNRLLSLPHSCYVSLGNSADSFVGYFMSFLCQSICCPCRTP